MLATRSRSCLANCTAFFAQPAGARQCSFRNLPPDQQPSNLLVSMHVCCPATHLRSEVMAFEVPRYCYLQVCHVGWHLRESDSCINPALICSRSKLTFCTNCLLPATTKSYRKSLLWHLLLYCQVCCQLVSATLSAECSARQRMWLYSDNTAHKTVELADTGHG